MASIQYEAKNFLLLAVRYSPHLEVAEYRQCHGDKQHSYRELKNLKTGFSPRENYTDRATAACQRS
jgi:hypothetical protein